MASDAQAAVRTAAGLVAQAITTLANLGPDAPSSVREALNSLGWSYASLGYADPKVPYSIPRDAG